MESNNTGNLALIIDRLEVGLIVLDRHGHITHWNRWMTQRSHVTADAALGHSLAAIFPEVANSRLQQAIEHATINGLPSLLSPALHGTLLPLFITKEDHHLARRMQQLTHILPIRGNDDQAACVIQISDMTANISRERLLRQQAENLRRTTSEDALTALPNRRKFEEVLANEFRKAQRRNSPLAMLIADIDLFSGYNEHYGREHGDLALAEIAAIFRSTVQPVGDTVARFGGEEFAFLLPGLSCADAAMFAENLRLRVAARQIPHANSVIGKYLTVSVGVAVMTPDSNADTHTLVSSADVALYQAKHEGRNCAVYFSIEDGSFKACG